MKRLLTLLLACLAAMAAAGSMHAQDTMAEDMQGWASEESYAHKGDIDFVGG